MEEKILNFLNQIEIGEIQITPTQNPRNIYAGNVIYKANNGWEITIFNDANEWDYIDNIKMSDEILIDFDALDKMIKVRNYEPKQTVVKEVYKIFR